MSVDKVQEWMKVNDEQATDINSNKSELHKEGLEIYKNFNGEQNSEILWRLARSAYKAATMAEITGQKDLVKKLYIEAESWALKSIEKNPECADAHSWLAYVCGKLSDLVSTKERIQKGKLVKQHLEEAIKYRPTDSTLYYTYGRWSLEVAKLTWLEKQIAAALIDTLPEATTEDALQQFLEAEKLDPLWRANIFYIGKAYLALKNYKEAIKYFDKASECEAKDEEDKIIEKELLALRKKYSCYRETK